MSLRRTLLLLLALAPGTLTGCDRGGGVRARSVVLIVADTLRADHMSLYGYGRDTTPRLAALARRGVVFDRARSQASCTFPSVNSLLTSRHPAQFLHQGFQNFSIPAETTSIAEILQARGYATIAVSASAVVRATPSKHNKHGGFQRGFATFDETCLSRPAACVNRRALALIDAADGPFFAYLHYLDPHAPYAPPKSHSRRFAGPFSGDPRIADGETGPVERTVFKRGRPDLISPRVVRHLMDLYDEEIAYLDDQLGRLVDGLEERGLLDETLVVLAADHGEEFLEHGSFAHCRTLYDTETRVPLVFWPPGRADRREGQRVATPVENLDVVPTILDFLGVAAPPALDGRSLRTSIDRQEPGAPRLAHSMQSNLRSIDDGRHKLIFDLGSGSGKLFDLAADPAEKVDLAAAPPPDAAALEERLHAWIRDHEQEIAARHGKDYARRVESGLRALGYLE